MLNKILFIDDDIDYMDDVVELLNNEELDCQFDTCGTTEEGLKHIKKNIYSLVILDLYIDEKSGLDIAKIIRKKSDVPIILLTGNGKEVDIEDVKQLKINIFYDKSGEMTKLVLNLSNYIKGELRLRKRKSLGEMITYIRKQKKLKQAELAEMIGVSQSSISDWEIERCIPDAYKLCDLADALGVSMDTLLDR